jgi:UDP-N-acetylmuramate--alanine ligase
MSLLAFQHFYLVGIKGVAMTSLAQCLVDANKTIHGSDVSEDFVTKKMLQQLQEKQPFHIDPLTSDLPADTDCLIYTAAHQGIDQSQVQTALRAGIPVYSQAEALAELFNQQQGIAVCGVGGKTTVSAMLTWILQKLAPEQLSYSVGVGEILGLPKTGQWQAEGRYFVAEADEYVINPHAREKGEAIVPRFSFLRPHLTICNNLRFDHPDVYDDFTHTRTTFLQFFENIQSNGWLLLNGDDQPLAQLGLQLRLDRPDIQVKTFGQQEGNDFLLKNLRFSAGLSQAELYYGEEDCLLSLAIPGEFNLRNGAAALAAAHLLGFSLRDASRALADFRSTTRRFELVRETAQQKFFDDYAHHPSEVAATLQALQASFPGKQRLVAFQPHTYSRTKLLFEEFVQAFVENLQADDQLFLLPIFASARESDDPSISSDLLVEAIKKRAPECRVRLLPNLTSLAEELQKADFSVALTMGAGDIYEVYQLF